MVAVFSKTRTGGVCLWMPMLLVAAIGAANTSQAKAGMIAAWTFETSQPDSAGPHVAEEGIQAGTASALGVHADPDTAWTSPVGNGSAHSWSSNRWNAGDYYQFSFSLLGFHSATVDWHQTRSGTGPADFRIDASIDGDNFTTIHTYDVAALTWTSASTNAGSVFTPISLGSFTDDQEEVFLRFTSNEAGSSTAGTNRIDNVTVTAQPIPEPSSLMLAAAAGAAGFLGHRRRRRRAAAVGT